VVGHPNRAYLWILSRTPKMDKNTYEEIVGRIKEKKFDISKLQKTVQVEL
jgi:apolipoprotein D and lipocalin family protein